jgi:hypothetical protein
MKRLLILIALLALVSGCGPELEYSTPKTEPGKVSKLIFVPSGHGSDVAVGFNTGKDGGMTLTPIDLDIPARYGIVFECPHGSFAVEGSKWVGLWKSLKEGQEVTIEYREVYEVDLTKPKSGRKFKKYDFLGASKVAS